MLHFIFFILSVFFLTNGFCASTDLIKTVSVFDVGQGNYIACKSSNDNAYIFDAGVNGMSKIVEAQNCTASNSTVDDSYQVHESSGTTPPARTYGPFVFNDVNNTSGYNAQNHREFLLKDSNAFLENCDLKAVFLSHPDKDHVNLVRDIIGGRDGTTPQFILGGDHSLYEGIPEYYLSPNLSPETQVNNDHYLSSIVEILGTNAALKQELLDSNADSLIIRAKGDKHSILFTGDATGTSWKGLDDIQADVFIVPHHGADTHGSTSKEVLDNVEPKLCVISGGYRYGHPKKGTIDIIFDYFKSTLFRTDVHRVSYVEGSSTYEYFTNLPVFTTGDNGTITIDLSSDPLKIMVSCDYDPVHKDSLSTDDSQHVHFSINRKKSWKELNDTNLEDYWLCEEWKYYIPYESHPDDDSHTTSSDLST